MGVSLYSTDKQEMGIYQTGAGSKVSEPSHALSPLRILIILEARSSTGSAKAVLAFAQEALRQDQASVGAEVSILVFLRNETGNAVTGAIQANGISLETVTERGPFDWNIVPQLKAIVERVKPDIIWTNAVKAHFLVRMAGLQGPPKWVAFHHGYTTTSLRTRVYNQLDRWSLRRAERVVTVCGKFASEIAGLGIQQDRIRVQHMAIRATEKASPAEAASFRSELGIAATTRVVLTVGRLSQEKGHDDLLRAMAMARELAPSIAMRLLMVGDGPEMERLKRTRRDLNLSEIASFVGHQDNVRPYYAIADVFVLPSHSEGSPNVLLEAMDAGVPVIATRVGGVPEIATDERDALLIQSHDIEGMAAAMVRLLSDHELSTQLTRAAHEVLKHHTPEVYFQNMLSILREAAAR